MRLQGRAQGADLPMRLGQAGRGEGGATVGAVPDGVGWQRCAAGLAGQRCCACAGLVHRMGGGGALGVERMRQPRHVHHRRHRAAPGAGGIGRAQGAAAVDAAPAFGPQQRARPVGRRHRVQQSLLVQELTEGLPGAVALRALELQRLAPARAVVHRTHGLAAMRAADAGAQRLMRQRLRRGHLADQRQQPGARQAGRLDDVEPHQVAGCAEIDLHRAAVVPRQGQGAQWRAAVAAGQDLGVGCHGGCGGRALSRASVRRRPRRPAWPRSRRRCAPRSRNRPRTAPAPGTRRGRAWRGRSG